MYFSLSFSFLFLLSVLVTVYACEDECQDGVTNAWIGKYQQGPMDDTFNNIAGQMSEMIPSRPDITTTLSYLKPILEEYENNLYDNLRTSIFPGFFHGKCENDGVTPPGCPNPDCPVVCGTPGSLVHFYPKLRYIAYNATRHLIDEILHPGSITYEKVYQSVSDACNSPTRRSGAFFSRSARAVLRKRDEVTIKRRFHDIMTSFLPVLEAACGGTGNGTTNGLPLCSWEEEMKNYILSFP